MLKLKELRRQSGLSQQELANMLSVSRSTVAMWETTSSEPDSSKLIRLSEIFGVSIDYLLENSAKPASTPELSDKDIMFALFEGSDNITDEMYEEVKQFARFVKERENLNEEKK